MAFPRSVDASLVENARPARQHLSRAKTQRENELAHVRPTLQLASPGCCEKVSAKLLHLHRQNQRICLCSKQSLYQKKIPGKDPGKSRIETNSANASLPCQKSSQKTPRRKARQQSRNQQSRKKTEPPCHRKAPPEQHLPRCRKPRTPLPHQTNPHHQDEPSPSSRPAPVCSSVCVRPSSFRPSPRAGKDPPQTAPVV